MVFLLKTRFVVFDFWIPGVCFFLLAFGRNFVISVYLLLLGVVHT